MALTQRMVGGVLRNAGDGQGWQVYTGVSGTYPAGSHYSQGLGELDVDSDGVLHVPLVPAGYMTGWFAAIPDEDLTRNGITIGVSGSKNEARIHFYMHTTGKSVVPVGANNQMCKGPSTNIWFFAVVIDGTP